MDKYEYKKTDTLNEEELNELGILGWELVAVSQYNFIYGITLSISYLFKRKIKSDY